MLDITLHPVSHLHHLLHRDMASTGRVLIDETTFDGDDVVYGDFRLGNAAVQGNGPVPEPTTLLLLDLGWRD